MANTNEKTLNELVEEFIDTNRLGFEGDNGVENLSKVAEAIGYQGHGYRYGSSLEEFLSDNPGAQQAIITWIGEQDLSDWKESIESNLEEEEELNDEDEGEDE